MNSSEAFVTSKCLKCSCEIASKAGIKGHCCVLSLTLINLFWQPGEIGKKKKISVKLGDVVTTSCSGFVGVTSH